MELLQQEGIRTTNYSGIKGTRCLSKRSACTWNKRGVLPHMFWGKTSTHSILKKKNSNLHACYSSHQHFLHDQRAKTQPTLSCFDFHHQNCSHHKHSSTTCVTTAKVGLTATADAFGYASFDWGQGRKGLAITHSSAA